MAIEIRRSAHSVLGQSVDRSLILLLLDFSITRFAVKLFDPFSLSDNNDSLKSSGDPSWPPPQKKNSLKTKSKRLLMAGSFAEVSGSVISRFFFHSLEMSEPH